MTQMGANWSGAIHAVKDVRGFAKLLATHGARIIANVCEMVTMVLPHGEDVQLRAFRN